MVCFLQDGTEWLTARASHNLHVRECLDMRPFVRPSLSKTDVQVLGLEVSVKANYAVGAELNLAPASSSADQQQRGPRRRGHHAGIVAQCSMASLIAARVRL